MKPSNPPIAPEQSRSLGCVDETIPKPRSGKVGLSGEISSLTPERVRFLYKQRREILLLYPGDIPRLFDAQYLEATLRILDTWRKQKIHVG